MNLIHTNNAKLFFRYVCLLIYCSCLPLLAGCGNVGEVYDITIEEITPNYPGDNGDTGINATLTWDAPTSNEGDNSCIDDLVGYKVYYGTKSGVYAYMQDLDESKVCTGPTGCGAARQCSYTINGLSNDTWYFVVKVYDDAGNESAYSNVAIKKDSNL